MIVVEEEVSGKAAQTSKGENRVSLLSMRLSATTTCFPTFSRSLSWGRRSFNRKTLSRPRSLDYREPSPNEEYEKSQKIILDT
jgi:hypothetical protein